MPQTARSRSRLGPGRDSCGAHAIPALESVPEAPVGAIGRSQAASAPGPRAATPPPRISPRRSAASPGIARAGGGAAPMEKRLFSCSRPGADAPGYVRSPPFGGSNRLQEQTLNRSSSLRPVADGAAVEVTKLSKLFNVRDRSGGPASR